jgi:phosphomannomutase/phosphoglucomutase
MSNYKLTQNLPPHMFRAYDIRGVVGEGFTEDNIYTIGRAFGSEAAARDIHKIVVARDGRLSGPSLLAALIQGLVDSGIEVINIGAVPTPVLYFATHFFKTGSGVMLTGSHNPPDYNGLKMMLGGAVFADVAIENLYARIEAQQFVQGVGNVEQIDVQQDYIERIVGDVHLAKPLHVVVDAGNGIAGELAPKLLRALGCEVSELFCEIDGHFPNHHPDPSNPKNLQDLIHKVAELKADVGLAFDGDGDRVGVVTDAGTIISADRQLMLYAIDVLSRCPGAKIIYDVKCTKLLAGVIREHGGEPLMWKTGHSLIKQKMQATGAPLAGELSGHVFFKERWFGFDDGLYTAARLLEILTKTEKSCEAVFAALPNGISTPEINVPMADDKKFTFVDRLIANANFADAELITLDGMRVEFADGWGLVRCSNTTPNLVLRFEADSDEALVRIQGEFEKAMLKEGADVVLGLAR